MTTVGPTTPARTQTASAGSVSPSSPGLDAGLATLHIGEAPSSSSNHSRSATTQSLHTSSTHVHLIHPREGFVDVHIPDCNLEALYTHQVPSYRDEISTPPSSLPSGRRERPRVSLAPHAPAGSSTSSTDKTALLKQIMEADEDLKRDGIRISLDDQMAYRLDADLRTRLRSHRDLSFISKWTSCLLSELDMIGNEIFTDEVTMTGIWRSFLYRHCNRFAQDGSNFVDEALASFGSWSDPPTTTLSNLDIGCWRGNRCGCGGEHKRRKVCTGDHQIELQVSAGTVRPGGQVGIHIYLQDGQLVFSGLNGGRREKLKAILTQLITQTFANKIAYNLLYNFEDMMVLQYSSKTHLKLSQVITRTAGANNISVFQARRPAELDLSTLLLYPTPLSTLVALATSGRTIPVGQFPRSHVQESRRVAHDTIRREERDARSPYPMSSDVSPNDDDSPSSTSPRGSNAFVSRRTDVGVSAPHLLARSLPNSLTRLSTADIKDTSQVTELRLRPSRSIDKNVMACTSGTAVGSLTQSIGYGRLWDVYEGSLNMDMSAKSPTGLSETSDCRTAILQTPPLNMSPLSGFQQLPSSPESDRSSQSTSHSGVASPSTPATSIMPDSPARVDIDVVFKLARPRVFRDQTAQYLEAGELTPDQARDCIKNEAQSYVDILSDLQGKVIPRFYGLYCDVESDTWVMVLENVGTQITEHDRLWDLPTKDKAAVINLYQLLHARGLVHNDICPRHILRHPDGTVRLIDFEASTAGDRTRCSREADHLMALLRGVTSAATRSEALW